MGSEQAEEDDGEGGEDARQGVGGEVHGWAVVVVVVSVNSMVATVSATTAESMATSIFSVRQESTGRWVNAAT